MISSELSSTTYHKLEANVNPTINFDRKLVLVSSRMMKKGAGNTAISVTRLAQLMNRSRYPCWWRLRHCRFPNVVVPHAPPSTGGQMNIKTAHGIMQAPALNMNTACNAWRKGRMILPTLRRITIIEAFARGRMGMLSRLKLRRSYISFDILVPIW